MQFGYLHRTPNIANVVNVKCVLDVKIVQLSLKENISILRPEIKIKYTRSYYIFDSKRDFFFKVLLTIRLISSKTHENWHY